MILQTGGLAIGLTSTRSMPSSCARASACSTGRIPSCSPSGPTTRTSRALMRRLVRASRLFDPRGSRCWMAMVRCLRQWSDLRGTLRNYWNSWVSNAAAGRRRIRNSPRKSTRVRDASPGVRIRGVLLHLPDPAHHVAQLLAHLLDGVRLLRLAQLVEDRTPDLVLDDELLRER